jgi:hypothetical protein
MADLASVKYRIKRIRGVCSKKVSPGWAAIPMENYRVASVE